MFSSSKNQSKVGVATLQSPYRKLHWMSGQFGDCYIAFDPQGVNIVQRGHLVGEVAQLLPVHQHAEATPFAADFQLGDRDTQFTFSC